jgi:hypothetical protein
MCKKKAVVREVNAVFKPTRFSVFRGSAKEDDEMNSKIGE